VIAWGYLVYAAIDFGVAARNGDGVAAWGLMTLAALGAIACLFFGLMLVARLMRVLGITSDPEPSSYDDAAAAPPRPAGPRPVGGKRALR
jgi:hypothetical protein